MDVIGLQWDINNGILLQFCVKSGTVDSNYLCTVNLPLSYNNNYYTIMTTLKNGFTPASYTQNVYSMSTNRPTVNSFSACFSS